MPKYIAVLTMVLMMGMVLRRVLMLRRRGVEAMNFGKTHRSDFLIVPFVLLFLYLIFAHAFGWSTFDVQPLFQSDAIAWAGVLFCLAALGLLLWSLVSFGQSFRVGIDTEHPDKLITTGVFAVSRNPIYVAFAFILVGQFLIFPAWVLLLYVIAGTWLVNRQVLREEEYLKKHYGEEYAEYSGRVRRYL